VAPERKARLMTKLGWNMRRGVWISGAFVLCMSARAAGAQSGGIAGTVRDSSGVLLSRVEIIVQGGPRVFTSDDGHFRFTKLAPGTYTLLARRIDLRVQVREIVVGDSVVTVDLTLSAVPRFLPPVVTSVARGGLSGVVEDSAHQPIANARVKIAGASREETTDAAGTFFAPVKPGWYMLQVAVAAFAPRVLSVKVPEDSGRHVVVTLGRGSGSSARQTAAISSLNERMMRTFGPMRYFTREDLAKIEYHEVDRLATFASVQQVEAACPAEIAGEGYGVPLWTLDLRDIELLEVYRDTTRRYDARRRHGCPRVIAWMRR
jgi:hypothetical protein